MAVLICTYCGYEGKGRPDPNRSEGVGGGLARIAGLLTMLPFHTVWKMMRGKGGSVCPNCHMPGMVKLTSDAGWLAKRKFEVESGALEIKAREKAAEEATPTLEIFPEAPRPAPRKKPVDPDAW